MPEAPADRQPEGRISRLATRLAELPANRAFAYGAVLVIQLRAMWGIWDRDLTGGDTASYYEGAQAWVDGLQVNFAWSPLYTSFLGTVDWLAGDPFTAITAHRVLIVLVLALLVLAVLRRLVPPWAALIGALWWASLPIVYDARYEVHIFAAIPLMAMVLLMTNDPSMKRRAWAIGLLVASAILVRQEAAFVAILLVGALVATQIWARRGGQARAIPVRRIAAAFGLPLLVAAALIGLAYERSTFQGEVLSEKFDSKHTVNVCQVYTFSYQQRHPREFTGSPWTECRALMAREFGDPEPTLLEAWRADPKAMLDFTTWNLRLLPQGLQVGLFSAAAGNLNPDYPPPPLGRWWAGALALLLFALVIAAAVALRGDWPRWKALIVAQRWAWVALAAIALVVLAVVIFTQRPRPSYMFGLSIGLIALAVLSLAVLAGRFRLTRWAAAGAALLPVVLLFALPFRWDDTPRPIADAYDRISEAVDPIGQGEAPEVLVSSVAPASLCLYVHLDDPCEAVDFNSVAAGAESGGALGDALDEAGATVLYLNPYAEWGPPVTQFLSDPAGWELVGRSERGDPRPWALLVRSRD